jgi:hypothetical protein
MTEVVQERLERVIETEKRSREEREAWQAQIDAEAGGRAEELAVAERRIAEARRVLEEARAVGEREREDRAALERRLSELAHREPAEAVDAAPTDDLPSVSGGAPAQPAAHENGASDELAARVEPADWLKVAQADAERNRSDSGSATWNEPAAEVEVEADAEAPAEEAEVESEAEPAPPTVGMTSPTGHAATGSSLFKTPEGTPKRSRSFVRLRRGKGDDQPTGCSACARAFPADSDFEIRRAGWLGSGGTYLCDTCQGDGWRLPEGSSLPYRAHAERTE